MKDLFLWLLGMMLVNGDLVKPSSDIDLSGKSKPPPRSNLLPHVVHFSMTNQHSMNQGKLQVVKQEMTRVNIDILGISELRWTGMGEFNSDDHCIYYCGQQSLEEMEQPSLSTKDSKTQYLDVISKRHNDLCSFPRQTIQYHSNPSLCPTTNAEAEVERFYEDL